ncbi:MAG: efflux RND transporter periplasmic adaptor subunit [Kiritimatiellales bacterium]|nr:efflux RND transporter periplasmic adaptor subunit [Kiritimatiellales bacterium]
MKKYKPSLIGLLALLVGGIGISLLFIHKQEEAEEAEESIESVVPVHVGQIVRTTLHGYEVAYGHIEAAPPGAKSPAARIVVHAAVDGVLVRIACRPGQVVEKGAVLFQLDARVAELALKEKQQSLEFARQEFARQEQLLKIEGTSEREYQQAARDFHQAEQALAAARIQLDYHSIRAPIAGTVTAVETTVGQAVQATQILSEILDPLRRMVSIDVPATAMSWIKLNQPVQVASGQTWEDAETVGYIAEEVDRKNGTLEVRAVLPAASTLRIGQFVQARILYDTHADCLAVPAGALVTDANGETFIATISGDRASRLPVVGKLREGGWIEVEGDGLKEGLEIATDGAYGLPAATRVEVIGR